MKAITVRQPFAGLIICGEKPVENRSRNLAGTYRGPVVIHASKTLATVGYNPNPWTILYDLVGLSTWHDQTGVALGTVDLVGVHHATNCDHPEWVGIRFCNSWALANNHHLVLANPRPFPEPIPHKGALGLWNFPDELLPEGWAL